MNQNAGLPKEEGRAPLREYLGILWLRKWSIILVTLVVLGAALYLSARQTPMYASEARFLVQPTAVSGDESAPKTVNMETERQLVASTQVTDRVVENLHLDA